MSHSREIQKAATSNPYPRYRNDRLVELNLEERLALARHGRAISSQDPFDLDVLARRAWQNVETAAAELTVTGSMELDCDPGRLAHVFENLYRNALEHVGDNVSITVGLIEESTGFYVEDKGPRIPEEKREEAFEPGSTTKKGGTGFGLPIIWSIIEAPGWDLVLVDGDADGALFEVLTETNGASEPPTDAHSNKQPPLLVN